VSAYRRVAAGVLAASLVCGAFTASAREVPVVRFHPGAKSLHDPLVPGLGNGGYLVDHYDIRLTYLPATKILTGRTVIRARLTQNLSRFDLDFALPARSVRVDGRPAAFTSEDGPLFSYDRELIVTPPHGLRAGRPMTVAVRYAADPAKATIDGYSDWVATATGIMCWDEPTAAAEWWYPGNDYPSDKATYDVRITTPRAVTAVSNGRLISRRVRGGTVTAHWRTAAPMASYLTVLAIGHYSVVRGSALGSIPTYYAYEGRGGAETLRARRDLARTPQVLRFLQSQWGPYPFHSAGALVVGYPFPSALETQTRPTYEVGLWEDAPHNMWAIVHENAHQWFGDSATMRRWNDIWLAEGFATYSEWVWSQAHHDGSAEQLFLATYHEHPQGDSIWSEPLDSPSYPLDETPYRRGAMLLQALRNRVGSAAFFTIMRAWAARHAHRNGTSEQFVALARTISGQQLTAFFHAWLSARQRPKPTAVNGFPHTARRALNRGQVHTPPSMNAITRSDKILTTG
jgi:aminopeptidase N